MRQSSERPRVYIAGPYSHGNPQANVNRAIDVGDFIADMGADVFIPHLCHYREMRHPRPYDYWIAEDLRWLAACHALYRMDGESPGADGEVAEARHIGIPVFADMERLREWLEATKVLW